MVFTGSKKRRKGGNIEFNDSYQRVETKDEEENERGRD